MATWPDISEALAALGTINPGDQLEVERCLEAAIAYLTYRCTIALDTEDPPAPIVPADIRRACVMLTGRLFSRRNSPEGAAGFGDFGVVRVTRIDPDIEAMLLSARSWGIA
jgi:hypothetical protein